MESGSGVLWVGPLAALAGLPACTRRIGASGFARVDTSPYAILVLAEAVLRTVDPALVRDVWLGDERAVVICTDWDVHDARLRNWLTHPLVSLATPARVGAVLQAMVRRSRTHRERPVPFARVHAPAADWCPNPPPEGSAGAAAIGRLALVARLWNAGEWAKSLGWSRYRLWRVCLRDLGAPPAAVLFWHVRHQVVLARARGCTLEVIARGLGYCDAASICHAWARRCGSAPPPRGERGGRRRSEGGPSGPQGSPREPRSP